MPRYIYLTILWHKYFKIKSINYRSVIPTTSGTDRNHVFEWKSERSHSLQSAVAANLISTGINIRVYLGEQNGRLFGTVGQNEIDLSAIFTTANTIRIFAITDTGAVETFSPGNPFSPLKFFVSGRGYAIVAKASFEFRDFYPSLSDELNAQLLAAVYDAIDLEIPEPSPEPEPTVSPDPSPEPIESPDPSPDPIVLPEGTIALTSPTSYRTFQRNTSTLTGSFTATGSYTLTSGTLQGIEVGWNGIWTAATIDPQNNTFTAILTSLPTGQASVEARFTDNTAIVAAPVPFVGIGERFLCVGQSNMSGRGTSNQTYTIAGNGIRATLFGNDYQYKQLADPYDSNIGAIDSVSADATAGGSYILPMASYFVAQGIPVEFIPAARGGTSSAQWLPGGNIRDRSTLFGSALHRAEVSGGVRGILWHQGETDADNNIAQSTSTANLRTIAETFEAQLGAKTFMVRLQAFTGATGIANRSRVIAAIQDAISQSSSIEAGPDFGDIITDDGYHFQQSSKLQTAAARWWAYLSNFYSLPGSTTIPDITPQGTVTIASPTANSSQTPGATIAVSGTYNFASGRLTGGLRVRVDGGSWTVFSANLTATSGNYSTNVVLPGTDGAVAIEVGFVDNAAVSAAVNVNTVSPSPTPAPLPSEDSDVTAYADNIVAASGTISTGQRSAHDTYVKASKASGTWQYIRAMHTVSGESLNAALVYLKKPSGVANSVTNNGFVSGDYSPTLGLLGGTNKYLISLLNPVSQSWNINTLGLWSFIKTNFTTGVSQTLIGHQNSSTSPNNFTFLGQYSQGEGGGIGVAASAIARIAADHTGLLGVNNESSRIGRFYDDGSLVATAPEAGAATLQNLDLFFMAMNNTAGATNFYTGRGLIFVVTEGLPQGLVSTFSTEISQLVTGLGR